MSARQQKGAKQRKRAKNSFLCKKNENKRERKMAKQAMEKKPECGTCEYRTRECCRRGSIVKAA